MLEHNEKILKRSSQYYVIGIGASAGGLEAIQKLFSNIREADNAAYIVVQHLSPEFKSLMDVILSNYTSLPTKVIKQDMKIEAGNIYLLSSNHIVRIEDDHFILDPYGISRYDAYPINAFLNSLAKSYKEKSVGIILSGTGSDGTIGVQTIKKFGGITLTQSLSEASFDGMPKSANDTGSVDLCLPVVEIADTIHSLVTDPDYASEYFNNGEDEYEEKEYDAIIELLSNHFNTNFLSYKRGIVSRQIKKTMMMHKIGKVMEYHHVLEKNPAMREELYQKFFIGVTEFCRDLGAFEGIEKHVFPQLLTNHSSKPLNDTTLRFWAAGCSTGEEVYTLAYLFLEFLEAHSHEDISFKIIATDINQKAIDYAKKGTYPKKAFKSLPKKIIEKYFTETSSEYTIVPSLRHRVIFVQHDLLKDPPFLHIDLILCRNVLIYIKPEYQKEIIERFTHALNLDRFIMLGASESVGVLSSYDLIDNKWKIYKKISQLKKSKYNDSVLEKISHNNMKFPHIANNALEKFDSLYQPDSPNKAESNLTEVLYQEMLNCFGIDGFFVDNRGILVGILGKAGEYLSSKSMRGVMSTQKLSDAVCHELKQGILELISQSKDKVPKTKGVTVKIVRNNKNFNLLLERYFLHHNIHSYYLIQISEVSSNATEKSKISINDPVHNRDYELEERNLQLQKNFDSLSKKHAAMRQDFMSFNEELQSANEELQSANEELYSVNAEYQQSIEKLQLLNNNMDNLLSSTHVGAVFLDLELRIRFYTQAVTQIFDLLESDIGRSIKNFNHNLVFSDMMWHIQNVMNTHEPFLKEVKSKEDRSFLIRILPYLSENKEVSGAILIAVDITALQQTKQQLKTVDKDLALALESGKMGIWRWGIEGNTFSIDHTIIDIFEINNASIIDSYNKFENFIHPEDLTHFQQQLQKSIKERSPFNIEFRIILINTTVKYIQSKGSVSYTDSNKTKLVTGICWDITDKVQLEKRVIDMQSSKLVLDELCDGWWDWDLNTNEEYLSPRFKAVLGYKDHELPNTVESWQKIIFPDDLKIASDNFNKHIASDGKHPYYQEVRYMHKDGHTVWVICRGKGIKNASGKFVRMVGLHSEITYLKEKELQLEKTANSDYLTKLPNRRLFLSVLERKLANLKNNSTLALAVIDIDNFKQVNDTLGHDKGDELLLSLANYLQDTLQQGSYIARTGGDEFSLILPEYYTEKSATALIERLIANINSISFKKMYNFKVTISLGLAFYPQAGKTPTQLIAHADTAMFQAKTKGKNQFAIFNKDLHEKKQKEYHIELELRKAIEEKALALAYQPIICTHTKKIAGLEVLSRWNHCKLGPISPEVYIPIAESTQLITPLTQLTFDQIIVDFQKLRAFMEKEGSFISLNISANHLQLPSFIQDVKKMLNSGIKPENLLLEITESALVKSISEIKIKLNDLQKLGVKTAIDDFGTGFSSLQYLQDLPIHVLKIDQTFVSHLTKEKYNRAIIRSVISMAQELGLKVTAEGVETKEQLEYLQNIHCDMLQGYYFARPMPLLDCLAFIREYQPK